MRSHAGARFLGPKRVKIKNAAPPRCAERWRKKIFPHTRRAERALTCARMRESRAPIFSARVPSRVPPISMIFANFGRGCACTRAALRGLETGELN